MGMRLGVTEAAAMLALVAGAPAAAQTRPSQVIPGAVFENEKLVPRAAEAKSTPTRPVPSTVVAVPAVTTVAFPSGGVLVGAIVLKGLSVLAPPDFTDIVDAHVGRALTNEQLSALAGAIAERARAKGYVFASARIDAQTMTAGVLRIRVDEGVLDAVRVEGPGNGAVEKALAPLVGHGPVTMAALERRLLVAGDVPGIYVRDSKLVQEGGRNVLVVRILHTHALAIAQLENDGSNTIGPEQLELIVNINGAIAADDRVVVNGTVTPLHPGEFQYLRARYSKRVAADGTEVSLGGSTWWSHPGGFLAPYDYRGHSWSLEAAVSRPLLRRRAASLWAEASFGVRDVEQRRKGELIRADRLAVAALTLSGDAKIAGGVLRGNATLIQGIGVLGATEADDPLASREDADGTFTEWGVSGTWTRALVGRASLRLAAQGQLASQPLLFSEEIGLGGRRFGRGYDYSERSGDEGIMGSAELRYDWSDLGPFRTLQVYTFLDGGTVGNLANGKGGGALMSTGGGLRGSVSHLLDANLELAVPMTGPRDDSGDTRPQLYFSLSKVF